jgi:hypothetical protein
VDRFTDLPSLAAAVAARSKQAGLILAVEGASQSRKTSFAGKLASRLGAHLISTDEYYQEGIKGERYQDGLRRDDLRHEIMRFKSPGKPVVIEGICLRETLAELEIAADLFIYCKRISPTGVWHDDPTLTDPNDFDLTFTQGRIDWWSHHYHERTRPHLSADMMFEWREDAL